MLVLLVLDVLELLPLLLAPVGSERFIIITVCAQVLFTASLMLEELLRVFGLTVRSRSRNKQSDASLSVCGRADCVRIATKGKN